MIVQQYHLPIVIARCRLRKYRQPGAVAVQSVGRASGAETPGKDIGYATRYVQRRRKLDSGQRRVQQGVLSQARLYPTVVVKPAYLIMVACVELTNDPGEIRVLCITLLPQHFYKYMPYDTTCMLWMPCY